MWMTLMIVIACIFTIICIWSAFEFYLDARKHSKSEESE